MAAPIDPILAAAAQHHGVVSRRTAVELGATPAALDKRVRSGRLTVIQQGVYLAAGAPFTWHAALLAACLAADGFASHRSAAVLLGVRGHRPGTVEISTRRSRHSRLPGVVVHRLCDAPLAPIRVIDGIPTSGPSRLAVDLGAVLPVKAVESAIQDLVGRRELTWDEVAIAVMRHSRRGRDGVGVARGIVERRLERLVGDSPLETMLLVALTDAGFPAPEVQVEVFDGSRFVARVDVAWPDRRVAVEADSHAFHGHAEAFEADRVKRNRLRALGWVVHEVTWQMLMRDRMRTLRDIAATLDTHPPLLGPLHVE